MKDTFNGTSHTPTDSRQPDQSAKRQTEIATKAEHDALVEARKAPAPALRLEPDAPERAAIDRRLEILREQRIVDLRHRLDRADERLNRGIEQSF
ncbi:hypothetical protein [Novosphingobium album (ex Liu et al. 2023)]|uniref:Uncharacterized protein n=1 Tax=Novosphingobium album (ex Liu et al. 2023) TaxID=3031130 RepID=A0ABT5WVG2_9SPHN|nr:hypothetical protein [Novosphingobium album (ex Liu et al. 2023)]MDE8653852.1 hypothetical protein [Novosphingobium album (ex Liu et al. 2023)]